jgi:hypothetical protein
MLPMLPFNGFLCLTFLTIASTAWALPFGYMKQTIPLNAAPAGLAFDSAGVLYALEGASFGSNEASMRVIRPDYSFGVDFLVIGDDPSNFFVGGMTIFALLAASDS